LPNRVRTGKKGIRAIGLAESFRKEIGSKAVIAGVVMRSDLLVDGFGFATCTVGGMDSTEKVIELWRRLERKDINVVLLSGSVISWFNVIDLNKLYREVETPLICLSYRESKGLDEVFRKRFPEDWETRLNVHLSNGERTPLKLKTGYSVFVRVFGVDTEDAKQVLDKFLVNGRYPEPVRLAKLLARSALNNLQPLFVQGPGLGNEGGQAL